ncbi:MAG: hypothetical protein IIC49_00885 [Planctomycetes bacterium]|nr:hypothetical protein [Planctomycetota bacterium]
MTRIIAAQLGLFAFGVTVCVGLFVGNSFSTVITRALTAMIIVAMTGYLAGWAGRIILRDHLLQRRLKIEREHHEKRKAREAHAEPPKTTTTSELGQA